MSYFQVVAKPLEDGRLEVAVSSPQGSVVTTLQPGAGSEWGYDWAAVELVPTEDSLGCHRVLYNGPVAEEENPYGLPPRLRMLHRNKGWLTMHYCTMKMTMSQMAQKAGVSYGAIRYWMDKHDIERGERTQRI